MSIIMHQSMAQADGVATVKFVCVAIIIIPSTMSDIAIARGSKRPMTRRACGREAAFEVNFIVATAQH